MSYNENPSLLDIVIDAVKWFINKKKNDNNNPYKY